jgi:uncharacterized protein (TIGR02453 family)
MKTTLPAFKGIPPEGLGFLRELKRNNNRDWFTPRLDQYKAHVQAPMLELIRAVHAAMLRFAPAYVGEPARCLYRIYRDTRFSQDKTPYKTHAAALFWRNSLEKNTSAGFYFAVSADEFTVGGGLYRPAPPVLLSVRQQIAKEPERFRATFESKSVNRLMGGLQATQTLRVPKGFRSDDPAAEMLRNKQFVLYTTLAPEVAAGPGIVCEIVSRFEAMAPFVEFLDKPLVKGARLPQLG